YFSYTTLFRSEFFVRIQGMDVQVKQLLDFRLKAKGLGGGCGWICHGLVEMRVLGLGLEGDFGFVGAWGGDSRGRLGEKADALIRLWLRLERGRHGSLRWNPGCQSWDAGGPPGCRAGVCCGV